MQNEPRYPVENILPFDGEAYLYSDFFTQAEADHLFRQLEAGISWRQEPIKIFGKTIMQPRLTAFYGDPDRRYSYSGIEMVSSNWTGILLEIKKKIEEISLVDFTSVLLNYYRTGHDSMGWHRDNEKSLGKNPVIASVSFGATRKFQLRYYADKKTVRSVDLTHGSLLLMKGVTQHYWEHQLPKTAKDPGARINGTFRLVQ